MQSSGVPSLSSLNRSNRSEPETRPEIINQRPVIASYSNYAEASQAVDFLSDRGFPVQHVAIVAEGLRLIEQVTGRLNWAMAVGQGAFSGAFTGLFFGLLFGLLNLIQPLVPSLSLAFSGLIFGAVVGAVLGLMGYAISGGKRDFVSVGGVQAERYNLVVDANLVDEAERLLDEMP